MIAPILALALQAAVTSAALSLEARAAPTITASGGTFVGATSGTVQQFYGIPFAEPPYATFLSFARSVLIWFHTSVGNLRFRLPKGITSYNGTIDATNYGPSCPQQAVSLPIVQGLAAEAIDYLVNSIFGQVFPLHRPDS